MLEMTDAVKLKVEPGDQLQQGLGIVGFPRALLCGANPILLQDAQKASTTQQRSRWLESVSSHPCAVLRISDSIMR